MKPCFTGMPEKVPSLVFIAPYELHVYYKALSGTEEMK